MTNIVPQHAKSNHPSWSQVEGSFVRLLFEPESLTNQMKNYAGGVAYFLTGAAGEYFQNKSTKTGSTALNAPHFIWTAVCIIPPPSTSPVQQPLSFAAVQINLNSATDNAVLPTDPD